MNIKMGSNIFVTHIAPLCLKTGDCRKATDKLFIVLFLINVLIWIMSGVNETRRAGCCDGLKFHKNLAKLIMNTAIHGIVAAVVMLSFIMFQSKLKCRGTVYLVTFAIAIQVFALLVLVPWVLFTSLHSYVFSASRLAVASIIVVVCLIYQIATLICVRESNVNVLSELIVTSCRAISHSLVTVIFSMITSFLALFIGYVTVSISYSMMGFSRFRKDEKTELANATFVYLFAFGGLYIINFIRNFGLLVTGDYFANYYGTSDKEKISKAHIMRSIMTILRNHLGTVALLSTPILPRIIALIMSFRNNRQFNKKLDDASINFVSKISLIMDITDFAFIQTAMYGSNAFKSMRKMLDLHQYSSTLFLTLNTVSLKFIEISMIIASAITIVISLAASLIFFSSGITINHTHYEIANPEIFILAMFYTILVPKILMRPAMSTFLIYKMTSIQISDASEKMIET